MDYLVIYLLLINIVVFWIYSYDKWMAKRDRRRIAERTLILWAVAGGSIGAFVSMQTFRHKTKKVKFYLGIPIIILLQTGLIYLLFIK